MHNKHFDQENPTGGDKQEMQGADKGLKHKLYFDKQEILICITALFLFISIIHYIISKETHLLDLLILQFSNIISFYFGQKSRN